MIRRALANDKQLICDFISETFADVSLGWVGECELALMQHSSTCYIAINGNKVIGFCCYDSSAKRMLGPLGFSEAFQCKGIAQKLIFCCFGQ